MGIQLIREAEGFIIAFGLNDSSAFSSAQSYVSKILSEVKDDRLPIVLLGTKSDLTKAGASINQNNKFCVSILFSQCRIDFFIFTMLH